MNETFTLYKLIILYMLDKVDFPMTTSHDLRIYTGSGIYQLFYTAAGSCRYGGFRLCSAWKTPTTGPFIISPKTAPRRSGFSTKRSLLKIQEDIDKFLNEKCYELKEEVSVKADYYLNTNHEFEVRCQIEEMVSASSI